MSGNTRAVYLVTWKYFLQQNGSDFFVERQSLQSCLLSQATYPTVKQFQSEVNQYPILFVP